MFEASQLPSDDPARAPIPVLRRGVRGIEVERVQERLLADGFDPGEVDGVYGPRTAAAVRAFQTQHKIGADGEVGPETLRLMESGSQAPTQRRIPQPAAPAEKAATPAKATTSKAAQAKKAATRATSAKVTPEAATPVKAARATAADESLREIQRALRAAGFDPGSADGRLGPNTAAAIRTFQLVHGLGATGWADAETVEALRSELRLSATVVAVARSAPDAVGPSELLTRILARHPEYGGNITATPTPEPGEVFLGAYEWLSQVRALFHATLAPELHGRLVVVGLALLDAGLAARLRDGLFDAVVRELAEPLDMLLTGRGDRLLGLMRAPRDVRDADRWSRLSPSCLAALAYADGLREAARLEKVHVEHVVASLDRDEQGPLRRLLDRAGVGRKAFAAALADAAKVALPSTATSTSLPAAPALSQHAGTAVEHAFRLAEAVGSDTVGRRYLLHGVLSVDGCGLVQALAGLGVHAADVEGWSEPAIAASVSAVRPMLLADPAADTVPEPGNGRVRRADRLGTAAEVEVLASVLLARDTTLPLAIGLFGDWGSGKSFFMAQMQERIAELADLAAKGHPEAEPFCREVRQVRFNAWHYVDSNLWASLAANLFDQLARPNAPDESEAQVKFDELEEARMLAARAQAERERLERKAEDRAAEVDGWRLGVTTSTAVAIRAVRNDRDLRAKLREAGTPKADDESTDRLIAALGTLDGVVGTARAAWRLFEEEVLHRRRRVTLACLAMLIGVTVAASVATDWPPLAKAVAFVAAAAAALTPALNGALRVLYLAREAREARQLPLVKAREELQRARLKEDEAKHQVAERERELAKLRDQGMQLQAYVRARATSPDYRDQLGVISKVRRDFEQLVALLPGSGRPTGAEEVVAVATAVTEKVPQVERIVLYIDDLDRCPHAKVIDVLQAVHLLLAFKLFVVVVGVDSRWLERSLREHYGSLLETPESYLEKIFQIPFTLRRMSMNRYRDLIDQLTPSSSSTPDGAHRTPTGKGTGPTGTGAADAEHGTGATTGVPGNTAQRVRSDSADRVGAHATADPPPLPRPEALVISAGERTLLRELGKIVATPRAAKRLVNIYRMLRVSIPDEELEAFRPEGGREYQAVVLLLAVLVGRLSVAEAFFLQVMASSDDDDIWQVISGFPELTDELAPLRAHVTLRRVAPYRRWAPRVSRFSLRLMAVVPTEDRAFESAPRAD